MKNIDEILDAIEDVISENLIEFVGEEEPDIQLSRYGREKIRSIIKDWQPKVSREWVDDRTRFIRYGKQKEIIQMLKDVGVEVEE